MPKLEEIEEIAKLGRAIRPERVQVKTKTVVSIHDSPNYYDDQPMYDNIPVFAWRYEGLGPIRKEARRKLEKIKAETDDNDIRTAVDKEFKLAETNIKEAKMERDKKLYPLGCGLFLLLASTAICFSAIKSYNYRERQRGITMIQSPYFLDKELDHKQLILWERKLFQEKFTGEELEKLLEVNRKRFDENEKMIDDYRMHVKENLNKGHLTPSHKDYKRYEQIFGNEEWWPKKK